MITKYKNQAVSAVRSILANRRAIAGIAAAAILIVALAVAFTSSSAQEDTSAQHGEHQSGEHQSGHDDREAIPSAASSSVSPEGADPASRQQTTLAAAASRPNGSGQRGDNPAAGVTGTQRRVDPDEVLGSPSNGCAIGYGEPGQCLPVYAETCEDVRQMFPEGIAVTGSDQLGFDSNGDKVACGAGE